MGLRRGEGAFQYMEDYNKAQGTVLNNLGIARSASAMISLWQSFIEECEAGFEWDYSEFLNEIRVRDDLNDLLLSEALRSFPEHGYLRQQVELRDQRFRLLLIPGVETGGSGTSWWRRGVLACAGEPYADYMQRVHGVTVAVTSHGRP